MVDSIFKEIKDRDLKSDLCIYLDGEGFVRLKESLTAKVTYSLENDCFCFWIDDEEDDNPYYTLKMNIEKLPAEDMLNDLSKLSAKKWYGLELQQDFLELFRYIVEIKK